MRRFREILRIAFLSVIFLMLMCSCGSTALNQQKQDELISESSTLSVNSFKNSYSDSLSCLSYTTVDTSKYKTDSEEAEKHIGKLNILCEINSGNAVITASKSDISNPVKCVDLDPSTAYVSDGSEKVTQIKITFTEPIPVTRLRTLIGEPGYDHITNDWWLETADTEADLISRKGSYNKLVPKKIDSCGKWEETVFSEPVLKKIWRFSIQKKVYDYCVSVPELEFYGPTAETELQAPVNLVVVKESATTITLCWKPSGGGSKAYAYEVYRNGEYIGNTCGTYYTDKGLKKETSYTYEVRAVSQTGIYSSASPSVTHSTSDHTDIRTDYNVIVLYYNPVIKAGTYQFYDSVLRKDVSVKINRNDSIADRYGEFPKMENYLSTFIDDFNRVSGGFADINIYETRQIDHYPPANNQAWLNDDIVVEFEELNKTGHLDPTKDYDVFHHGSIDYNKLIQEENLIPLIESGKIDAVWVFCTYPYSGFYESVMAGNDSYYCNGPASTFHAPGASSYTALAAGQAVCLRKWATVLRIS